MSNCKKLINFFDKVKEINKTILIGRQNFILKMIYISIKRESTLLRKNIL